MTSKLSALCDRLIEAGWLAALIVTPLVFDVLSYRSFDLDKVALLRSLALLMAAAWTVKALDTRPRVTRSGLRQWVRASPETALALLWLAVTVLSTATSVAPRVSWEGSYERWQGLYTTIAYVVLFLSIVALLKTRDQLERLITTVLVVTLPVSLYAIIQHFGTDPIVWRGGRVAARAASTLGNPIFLAAYLGLTVPLTVYRLLASARALGEGGRATATILTGGSLLNLLLHVAAWWFGPVTGSLAAITTMVMWIAQARVSGRPLAGFARVGIYTVILSTQLAAIVLSQSRGPLLGLAVGLLFFALLWTAARGTWKWTLLVAGAAAAIALATALINLPGSPLASLSPAASVGRLGRFSDSGLEGRVLFWEGAWRLITSDAVRALIGNGPETMRLMFPRFTPPGIARLYPNLALDRSHNETFDLLVTTGGLGLAAYLALITAVFHRGLKALGLVRSRRERGWFLGLGLGVGLAAALGSGLVARSGRLSGLALPLGMLGGMFIYLSGRALAAVRASRSPHADDAARPLIVSALLAGIVAHFTEIQLGIAVESTRTCFWVYAALLVVATRAQRGAAAVPVVPAVGPPVPSRSDAPARSAGDRREWLVGSVLATFVLLTLVYDFLSFPLERAQLPSIGWLLGFTWVAAGLVVLTEPGIADGSGGGRRVWPGACVVYAGITVPAAALFAAVLLGLTATVETSAPVAYHAATLLTLAAIAAALASGALRAARAPGWGLSVTALGLFAGACGIAVITNLGLVRADIVYKRGWISFHRDSQYATAVEFSSRAAEMAPAQPVYRFLLGQALVERAQRTASAPEREALFRQAEQSLLRARDLNPRDVDGFGQLAHLDLVWGSHASDPSERAARLRAALDLYRQATEASPSNALLWDGWGITLFAAGDEAQAREKLGRALALDEGLATAHLHLGDVASAGGRWEEAARAYTAALARDQNSVAAHRALAVAYARTGRPGEAVRHLTRVVELAPDDLAAHRGLAQLYTALGQPDRARAHAERVRTLEARPLTPAPGSPNLFSPAAGTQGR